MELALDTAGDIAGVALSREGCAILEVRWAARRNHNAQLLPTVKWAMDRANASKDDLTAVFVCQGPGSYMGVRVAMATAKGLALALGLPIVGVNRLSLDAWPHRAYAGPIVAVHKAGRRQWAWAAYAWDPPAWRELQGPRLDDAESLAHAAPAGLLLCGEPDEELCAAVRPGRVVRGESAARRPAGLSELGWLALQERGADDLAGLAPIYLREPAIGPQQEAR